jgi:CubicO group peptidase (beta-lactamase class C family)
VNLPHTRLVLDAALADGAFPAAVVEVGRASGRLAHYECGRLTFDPDAPSATPDTIFDLASLTKVMATTSLTMRAARTGDLTLDSRLGAYLRGWTAGERTQVRLRHLLDHSSGLPAHGRFWEVAHGRTQYEEALLSLPLERTPGAASVYSDPGFMLLGFVLEDVGDATLPVLFEAFADEVQLGEVRYGIEPAWRPRVAPT